MANLVMNSTRFQSAEKRGLCPVCGEVMKEVDRMKEGQHFFIWFKCAKEDCQGQWLQKQPVWQEDRSEMAVVNNHIKALSSYLELALR